MRIGTNENITEYAMQQTRHEPSYHKYQFTREAQGLDLLESYIFLLAQPVCTAFSQASFGLFYSITKNGLRN
jgi:hypothetical protein